MTCPFLEYRREAADRSFETARAYCGAAERFVQPMRADVCNDRYDLEHATDCEIYLRHADEGRPAAEPGDGDGPQEVDGDGSAGGE